MSESERANLEGSRGPQQARGTELSGTKEVGLPVKSSHTPVDRSAQSPVIEVEGLGTGPSLVPHFVTRVLLVGTFRSRVALEWCYLRALRASGKVTVDAYDLETTPRGRILLGPASRPMRWLIQELGRLRKSALLPQHLLSRQPYDFVLVIKGKSLTRHSLETSRKVSRETTWGSFYPDDPFDLVTPGTSSRRTVENLPLFDIHFTWSRRLVPELATRSGKTVLYVPFGYDPELHHEPAGMELGSSQNVCFVGSWDPAREALLGQLTEFNLELYGSAWDRLSPRSPLRRFVRGGEVGGDHLCRPVARAAVSLNLLRLQNRNSHNMRTFEIPAAGGLLVTRRTAEQQEFFPDGVGSVMYQELDELKECIRRCLKDTRFASSIRGAGRERVKSHTYSQRVQLMVSAVESLRGSGGNA